MESDALLKEIGSMLIIQTEIVKRIDSIVDTCWIENN